MVEWSWSLDKKEAKMLKLTCDYDGDEPDASTLRVEPCGGTVDLDIDEGPYVCLEPPKAKRLALYLLAWVKREES